MTTSYVLTKTVGEIIEEGLRAARLIAVEQPVQPIDIDRGLNALNNVIKLWQTTGVHLWAIDRAVLPLVKDQKKYTLGPSGDKCGTDDTFFTTTLSAAGASGQTVLSVASTSDMAAAQNIGIELADGTRFWTTIASVGASSVTVDDALTGTAASGASVYFYTTQITKPMRLANVMWASNATASEIPVEPWSRQEYMEQTDKGSRGTVVNWYYQRKISNGELYVWQVASSAKSLLKFDIYTQLSVYTSESDDLNMPEEYFEAVRWAIGAALGPEYGVKIDRQAVLEGKATAALEQALDFDVEHDSVSFVVDNR